MRLHRTPITWAIYGVNGAWAAFIYLTGPVSPILSEDLGMSLAAAGLIGTALALGIITASLAAPRAVRTLGRDRATKAGLVVVAAGLVGMVLVPLVASGSVAFGLILGLVWVSASGGGTMLNASMARLSDAHPLHSARVITEANAAAAWVGLFSPLILGAALGAGLGWEVGILACLVLAVAALVGLVVADRVTARSGRGADAWSPVTPAGLARVGRATRAGACARSACTRTPRCLLRCPASSGWRWSRCSRRWPRSSPSTTGARRSSRSRPGRPAASATAAMAAVVAGVAIGRTIGSALTLRLGPHRMLLGGFGLALVGFGVLWTAGTLPLSVVGLFVAGLGIATLFPLLLDRGIVLSAGHPDHRHGALLAGPGPGRRQCAVRPRAPSDR